MSYASLYKASQMFEIKAAFFWSKGDCDFEYGFCGWENSRDDDFDWVRHTRCTATLGTGPCHDHTTGNIFGPTCNYS